MVNFTQKLSKDKKIKFIKKVDSHSRKYKLEKGKLKKRVCNNESCYLNKDVFLSDYFYKMITK